MQPTEAKTIKGVKLNGWRFQEKIYYDEYDATLYASDDGVPKYFVFEGPPDLGGLATLVFQLGPIEVLEDASICSPPTEEVYKIE